MRKKQQGRQQQGQQQQDVTAETVEPNPQWALQQAQNARRRLRQQQSKGGGKQTPQAPKTVQPQPRISGRQLMLMIALSRFTVMVVFLPVATTGTAGRNAWLAAVLAVLGGMVVGTLAAVLSARFPGQSIGGFARAAAGIPGLVLAAIYAGFYVFIAVAETRLLTALIIDVSLPRTPGWAIVLPILVVAVYGAALGPDTAGRATEILITSLLASLFLALVLLLASRQMEPALLRPVLAFGIRPVLSSTINPIFWFAMSAGLVLALGKYCEPNRLVKSVLAGTAISGMILITMALTATMTLGVGEVVDRFSPLLGVARTVFFRGVVERMDVLLLNTMMIGAIFDMTLFLLVAAVIISDIFRVRGRAVVIVLGMLAVAPLVYRRISVFDLLKLFDVMSSGIMLATVHIGIVGLLLLVALIRGKKGESGQ
ncbi:MAG: GerAB/ArcD/ProY family transporter [Bacillota bacterium]|nr:GerAB/ArcD/ProY family transporter [Bacillota bacterium]